MATIKVSSIRLGPTERDVILSFLRDMISKTPDALLPINREFLCTKVRAHLCSANKNKGTAATVTARYTSLIHIGMLDKIIAEATLPPLEAPIQAAVSTGASRCFLGSAEKPLLTKQLLSRIARNPIILDANGAVIPEFLEELIQDCLKASKGPRNLALMRLRQIVTSLEIAKIFNLLGIEAGRITEAGQISQSVHVIIANALLTQDFFINKRRLSGIDEQTTDFLTRGQEKLNLYEDVDENEVIYEEDCIKATCDDFFQCRELLQFGKNLTFPTSEIVNMIINISTLISKLANMVVGQDESGEVDEYIRQRSISSVRVVDPYLASTRAANTSSELPDKPTKRSRTELDVEGALGGVKSDKKSIVKLTKNVAKNVHSIGCRMNHVSQMSKVDVNAQVTTIPLDPNEEERLLARKRDLLRELHDINESLYSMQPCVISHNKASSVLIINNPYEKSVVVTNNIPYEHVQDLVAQFTDITQSHISSASAYTKSPHTHFDTDKYMASLTVDEREEILGRDVEDDNSNNMQS